MVSWSMVATAPRGWGRCSGEGVGVARLPGIGESLVDESGAASRVGSRERVGRGQCSAPTGRAGDPPRPSVRPRRAGQCLGRAVDGQGVDRRTCTNPPRTPADSDRWTAGAAGGRRGRCTRRSRSLGHGGRQLEPFAQRRDHGLDRQRREVPDRAALDDRLIDRPGAGLSAMRPSRTLIATCSGSRRCGLSPAGRDHEAGSVLAHQLLEQVAGARELDRELGLDDLDPAHAGRGGAPHGPPGRVCLVPAEGLETISTTSIAMAAEYPQPESARFRGQSGMPRDDAGQGACPRARGKARQWPRGAVRPRGGALCGGGRRGLLFIRGTRAPTAAAQPRSSDTTK